MSLADKQYTLGKGKVYVDLFLPGTKTKTGERFVGNAPSFTFTSETQKLDHFSSTGGIRIKDASVLLELNRTGTLTIDNISDENLALFAITDFGTVTATSAPVTQELLTDSVKKGYFYQVGTSSSNQSGVRKISAVTVKQGATYAGAATLVLNTDYKVDLTTARVEILETSVTVTAGSKIWIDYTVDASTRTRAVSSSQTQYGALRFIAENPTGANRDIYMPYVGFSPNGEFSVISEEWASLALDVEILVLDSNTASMYIDGRPT